MAILEVAILDVKAGRSADFKAAFARAEPLIASMAGYLGHELRRCMERDERYLLLVNWETIADHTEGFRQSPEYAEWKRLLHDFYDPFPIVEHYAPLDAASTTDRRSPSRTDPRSPIEKNR